ncbi:cell division protein FtsW, partial [Gardnerella vaginalis]
MNMLSIRIKQISLLLFSIIISSLAFLQMFLRINGYIPADYIGMLTFTTALYLVLWGVLIVKKPYCSQVILPCMLLLTTIGTVMIARIDKQHNTDIAMKQLIWVCVALVLSIIFVLVFEDYRILRRFSYVSMIIGLILLLSPMLPIVG